MQEFCSIDEPGPQPASVAQTGRHLTDEGGTAHTGEQQIPAASTPECLHKAECGLTFIGSEPGHGLSHCIRLLFYFLYEFFLHK